METIRVNKGKVIVRSKKPAKKTLEPESEEPCSLFTFNTFHKGLNLWGDV